MRSKTVLQLIFVWAAVAGFGWAPLTPALSAFALSLLFAATIVVIMYASFGVLRQADALAEQLGEPFGSLILTLTVVIIEVVLISAVMLGPTPAPTIGRDSIFSVMMIIMNLVVGAAILLGWRRHGRQTFDPRGTRLYLVLISLISLFAFLGPSLFRGPAGQFPPAVAVGAAVVTAVGYATFLFLQVGTLRPWFQDGAPVREEDAQSPVRESTKTMASRFGVLVLLLVAISFMAEHLATEVDIILARTGWPQALGGLLIATIVFTPETLTSLSAALSNQMQRVINLCEGAFLSTIALSFPSVLILGLITGQPVIFGLDGAQSALLVLTLLLSAVTFRGQRTEVWAGWAHLGLFGGFVGTIFV